MSETKIPSARLDTTEFTFTELAVGNGTAALPSYSFSGDQNTGIYTAGADTLNFSTGGVARASIDSTSLYITMPLLAPNGSAAAPSISFNADIDSGWFGLADNSMRLSLGGIQRFIFDAGALYSPDGSAAAPSYTFVGDTNTGMFRSAANVLDFSSNGITSLEVTSGQIYLGMSGTVALPALSFIGDSNTGIYRPGVDQIAIAAGGVAKFAVDSTGGLVADAGYLRNSDGTAAIPSYSFSSDPDTGIYSPGAGGVAVSTNGTRRWTFDAAGALVGNTINSVLFVADGAAGAPGYTFDSDQDTGVYRRLSDSVGVATGGGLRFDFNNAVTRSHVPMEILSSSTDATLLLDSQSTGRASQISFRNFTPITHRIGIETDTDSGGGAFAGPANSFNIEAAGSNVISFNTNSLERWRLTGATWRGIDSTAGIEAKDGTAASPSYAFTNDTDTGIYRVGSNNMAVSTNGTLRVGFNSVNPAFTEFNPSGDGSGEVWQRIFRQANVSGVVSIENDESITRTATRTGIQIRNYSTSGIASVLMLKYAGGYTGDIVAGLPFSNAFVIGPGGQDIARWVWNFGSTAGNAGLYFVNNSGIAAQIHSSGVFYAPDGTAGAPALSFFNDTDTGIFRSGSNDMRIAVNSAALVTFNSLGLTLMSGDLRPETDNTQKCGISGKRWSEVWAANGTIQTSHSSTKENIVELDPLTVEVPQGVYFDRDGRRWLGYLNDVLPQEGRPVEDPLSNYEQAVIGVLCAHVRKLEQDNAEMKSLIQDLKNKVEA